MASYNDVPTFKDDLYFLTRLVRQEIREREEENKETDFLNKICKRLYDDYWRDVESKSLAYIQAEKYFKNKKETSNGISR